MASPAGWTPVSPVSTPIPAQSGWTPVTPSDTSVPSDEDIIKNAGAGETHYIRDFFGNLGKSLNPMPALNAAEDRQNQETAQFHQQLNDKQYTEALKTFVRSVPGADTIRAEGQNTIDSLKKAYQDYTRDQQNGGQTGAAFKDAVSAIPFIGRPTVAAGEQWDRGDKAGALGSATPIVAPSLLGVASVGIPKVAPLLGDAADAVQAKAASIKPALAQTITEHPQLTRLATAAGSGLATATAAHAIPGGAPIGAGFGTYLGGRYLGNIAIDWAQKLKLAELGETLRDVPDDALLESQKNPPLQLKKQVRDIVGTGEGAATTRLIEDELARRQQAKGVPMFGGSPPPSPAVAAQRANPATPLWQQAGTEATPPPAPPDVNPIQALQTPSGRKPGGIQNQVADDVKPAEAPAPVGPSPQLLDAIKKAVGPKGNIQAVVDDMISRGEKDPYTGAPLGVAPQPVSAPTAPAPAPVANPIAAMKTPEPAQAVTPPAEPVELTEDPMTIGTSALPHSIAPADVTVVHDTWPYEAGGRESVSLITGQGLSKLAKAEGKSPAEMRQVLQADNYTIPTTQQLWQAYMSRVKEMFGLKTRDEITQKAHGLLQNDWGLERGTTPTEEQLLKSYGSVLKNHQGPMSPEHIANVTYMKAFEGQPQPVNLPPKAFSALPQVPGTQGPSLEDLLGRSLPPQP